MRKVIGSLPGFVKTGFSTIVGVGIGAVVGTATPVWLIGGGVVGWLVAHGLELAVEKRGQKQIKGEPPVDAEFKVIPSRARDPLTIPVSMGHDEGEEPCFMEWPDLERESPGEPWIYTHRVFRIRVKNNSPTETAEGVNVILLRVGGIPKHHDSIKLESRLNVKDHNTPQVDITPGASEYFDAISQEHETSIRSFNDVVVRYASFVKPALPIVLGRDYVFTFQVRGRRVLAAERDFILSFDGDGRARFREASASSAPSSTPPPSSSQGAPIREQSLRQRGVSAEAKESATEKDFILSFDRDGVARFRETSNPSKAPTGRQNAPPPEPPRLGLAPRQWDLRAETKEGEITFIAESKNQHVQGDKRLTWYVIDPNGNEFMHAERVNRINPASVVHTRFYADFVVPERLPQFGKPPRGLYTVKLEARPDIDRPPIVMAERAFSPTFPTGVVMRLFTEAPSSDGHGNVWAFTDTIKRPRMFDTDFGKADTVARFRVGVKSADEKTYGNLSLVFSKCEPAVEGIDLRRPLKCVSGNGKAYPGDVPLTEFQFLEDVQVYGHTFVTYSEETIRVEFLVHTELTLTLMGDGFDPVHLVVRLDPVGEILCYELRSLDTDERWH